MDTKIAQIKHHRSSLLKNVAIKQSVWSDRDRLRDREREGGSYTTSDGQIIINILPILTGILPRKGINIEKKESSPKTISILSSIERKGGNSQKREDSS